MRKLILMIMITMFAAQVRSQSDESANLTYGMKLYDDKIYDVAITQFRSFLEQYPTSISAPLVQYSLAESYLMLGDEQNALRNYQKLILDYPRSEHSEQAIIKTAELFERSGDKEKAARYYLQLKNYFPKSNRIPETYYKAALLFRESGMNDQAKDNIALLRKSYPSNNFTNSALVILARIYEEENQTVIAESTYRDAFRSASNEMKPKTGLEYSRFLKRQNDLNGAEKIIGDAVRASKPDHSGYYDLIIEHADIMIRLNKYEEAAKMLDRERNIPDQYQSAVNELKGDLEYFKGNYSKALPYFEAVPDSARGLTTLIKISYTLSALEKFTEAGNSFYGAAVSGSENEKVSDLVKSALLNSADNFFKASNHEKGVVSLKKYLELFPKDEHSSMINFMIGRSYYDSGRLSAAFDLLRNHPLDFPGSEYCDNSLFLAAESAFKLEQWDNAAALYSSIINNYGASEYRSLSQTRLKYLKDHKLRQKDVSDKLADLSSRALFEEDKAKLLLDWSKFYFFDMKDYAKADHFVKKHAELKGAEEIGTDAKFIGAVSAIRLNIPDKAELKRSFEALVQTVFDPQVAKVWKFRAAEEIFDAYQITFNVEDDPRETLRPVYDQIVKEQFDDQNKTLAFKYFTEISKRSSGTEIADKLGNVFSGMENSIYFEESQLLRAKIYREAGEIEKSELIADKIIESASGGFALYSALNMKLNSAATPPGSRLEILEKIKNRFYYARSASSIKESTAEVYLADGRPAAALKLYRELDDELNRGMISSAWSTGSIDYAVKIADIYLGLGETDKAETYYLRALSNRNADIDRQYTLLKLSDIYRERNDRTALEENLKALSRISEGQTSYSASLALADIELDKNNITKAIDLYRDILKKFDPEDKKPVESKIIVAYYNRKSITEADKLLDNFRKTYKNDYDKDVYEPQFYLAKANAFLSMNEYDKALKAYKALLKDYPESPQVPKAMYGEAIVYYNIGKSDDAFNIWVAIVNKFPDDDISVETNYHLGAVYNNREQFDKAITAFQNILKYQKDHNLKKNSMKHLIDLYQKLGFNDAASRIIREYIAAYPDEDDIFAKRIEIGLIHQRNEEYDTALDYFRRLQYEARGEDEVAVQFYIADTYLLLKNYRQAITEFLKVRYMKIADSPYEWKITAEYKTALCYEELGEFDKAIELLNGIAEKRPNDSYGRQSKKVIERIESKKNIER
ncbi:MAG: tetratricopeptide repeat protein [Candidatus Delongbacteria bacterium]|nr:tetratricopeptide repeat protein [Candidatus Delongbacteria bacterium]